MTALGVQYYSFINAVPDKTGAVKLKDVDFGLLNASVDNADVVITLGTLAKVAVNRTRAKNVINAPHPSPRNRKFNNECYEANVLAGLKLQYAMAA